MSARPVGLLPFGGRVSELHRLGLAARIAARDCDEGRKKFALPRAGAQVNLPRITRGLHRARSPSSFFMQQQTRLNTRTVGCLPDIDQMAIFKKSVDPWIVRRPLNCLLRERVTRQFQKTLQPQPLNTNLRESSAWSVAGISMKSLFGARVGIAGHRPGADC